MENEPEVIRQEMQETRSALSEKLEALEQHVMDSVQTATTAVTDTVDTVKEAIDSTVTTVKETIGDTVTSMKDSIDTTVDSVKDTFDVPGQMVRHPWVLVGGAVFAGYMSGRLFGPASHGSSWNHRGESRAMVSNGWRSRAYDAPREVEPPPRSVPERAPSAPSEPPEPPAPSMLTAFEPEIARLKGLAIGALFNLLKGTLHQWVPPTMKSQVEEVVDNMTSKLGGKPIEGSLLDECKTIFERAK